MTTSTIRRDPAHPPEQGPARPDAEPLGRWFMRSDADLGPGAHFELHDPHARGWSGRLRCEMLEFTPHERLRHRADEVAGTSVTTLTWTLAVAPGGTALTLEHAGWEGMRGWLTGMALKLGWSSLPAKRLPAVLGELTPGR